MKPLINGFVSHQECSRFLELIDKLENINSNEVKMLNLVCDENKINLDKNKIMGIFN